jgi:hypothetical protein
MEKKFVIKGMDFRKSSFSGTQHFCVGVAFNQKKVFVTNTDGKVEIINFSLAEWDAFVKGVKNGEFDV